MPPRQGCNSPVQVDTVPEPDRSAKHVAGNFIPAAQGAMHKPSSSLALGAVQPGSCREKRCLLARAEGCYPGEAVLTPMGLLCYCQPRLVSARFVHRCSPSLPFTAH